MRRGAIVCMTCGVAAVLAGLGVATRPAADGEDAANPQTVEQADWLRRNAISAEDYVLKLYQSHQVIIFGEAHNVREHKTFLAELLGRLYNEAKVRCLAWEFSCPEDNEWLKHLVTAEEFDEAAVLAFARDQYLDWNSADHWDLIRAVWRINHARPLGKPPMRMVGLRSRRVIDAAHKWYALKPGSPRYWELLELMVREDDAGMAREVEREIIAPSVKGLVFVGRSHDMTKYTFPSGAPKLLLKRLGTDNVPKGLFQPDKPWRAIMGNLLYQKHGNRVFQIWPYSGLFPGIEGAMAKANLSNAGFTVEGSVFEDVKSSPQFVDAPGVPMKRLAQGFVYLGALRELHANRVIPGFISKEMFERHRKYYETDYGRSFNNAQELDEYLQKHRWPWRIQEGPKRRN